MEIRINLIGFIGFGVGISDSMLEIALPLTIISIGLRGKGLTR
jgi:hypothetical protein